MSKVASALVYVPDTNYIYFFLIYLLTLSTALNTYTSDGINYWNSTSPFVPIQNKSYGTLKLKTGFHMTFDILFKGKTAASAWENIFRIGHAGHSPTDYKCSKNDRFPAMWIDDTTNSFIFDVSDKSNCFRQYSNYIISPNISYSITINYNSTWIYISLNNTSIVNQERIDSTDIHKLDTDIYIYISTATSIAANVILSNIHILTYYDNSYIPPPPSNNPTSNPSQIPTIKPTYSPVVINKYTPTLSPNINTSPTKKPTTFFPTIFTSVVSDVLYSTEQPLHATTKKSSTVPAATSFYDIVDTMETIYSTDMSGENNKKQNGLSFEVIFYILTGCAMGGILFCVCTCCCFGCIINKKIKILATDESNLHMYDNNRNEFENDILSIKNNAKRDTSDIIILNNGIKSPNSIAINNKIRIQTMSDENDSSDSNNNDMSPTTSPSNCKYSSPSSAMSKSIHSFNGINSRTNSPNTMKFIKRKHQKHLSPKTSNTNSNKSTLSKHSTIRRINTKSVPIIDINQLLNEDIISDNHKVAIQRNKEISQSNPDIGVITIDFIDTLTERTVQTNHNNTHSDNSDNSDNSDTDDTDNDCKIISSNHSLLSPLKNNNNNNNKTMLERGHYFECRNSNKNKKKLKKITTFSNPSTNYSLYVHTSDSPNNSKYKALNDKNKQYQIQVTNTGENSADDCDESINSISNSNSQYETEQLYDIKSLGDIEMESNQIHTHTQMELNNSISDSENSNNELEEHDMKNETLMNTNSQQLQTQPSNTHTMIIKPKSLKSFKSYKTINNRIINRTQSQPQQMPQPLMNNISEISSQRSAKVFLQLPGTADSQMSAESISSNGSMQSNTSCSSSSSNSSSSSSNGSSSSYSSSNSSTDNSCDSESDNSSECSDSNSNSNSSESSSNTQTSYNKTQYTNTTLTNNNTSLVVVGNNDKFNHGNNDLRSNNSQSTGYYTNTCTPHSL